MPCIGLIRRLVTDGVCLAAVITAGRRATSLHCVLCAIEINIAPWSSPSPSVRATAMPLGVARFGRSGVADTSTAVLVLPAALMAWTVSFSQYFSTCGPEPHMMSRIGLQSTPVSARAFRSSGMPSQLFSICTRLCAIE